MATGISVGEVADSKVHSRKSFKGLKSNFPNLENSQNQQLNSGIEMPLGTWMGVDNRVSITLAHKSKEERRELRRKLEAELNVVRDLINKLEYGGGNNNDVEKFKRVYPDVGSVDQLSAVRGPEHNQGMSDNVEKEKRTPKANQFYQSSDFIMGKDRIPPLEHNKKAKGVAKKIGDSGFGMGSKVFKNSSLLLERLMKHKHGWVFNDPVDVKALGLHDYFTVIKHPMDLGTVKSRLNTNWYKSPKEFAEDVRLTFRNAMTYNAKDHDVYIMADILLKMFEEKWPSIETEYVRDSKTSADSEASLLTSTSRKAPTQPIPLPPPVSTIPKITNSAPPGRTPVPRKPKAKDPNKRNMTFTEKQKLSNELRNLPPEKLDNVVQIIRKRNTSLCQNDDEIEVDIDSVDIETLWELDRFVLNYKKSLSKIKKKIEVPEAKDEAGENQPEKNELPALVEEAKEKSKPEENNAHSSPHAQNEKQDDNAVVGESDHSRGSGSDSGSSSSESDSDTS